MVYEVQDLARAEIVALKTLRQATPAGIYRLKHEFRSLAGVAHPNVVCLYELVVEDARCFFTMEFVKGVNFLGYVRGGPGTPLSTDRLTSALRQLVDGVSLQDDEQGRELRRQAEEWMAAQHIKNPACMTRMLAPGFPDGA